MSETRPATLINMPTTVRGFCYHDGDGEEFVILNSRLTREANQKTWLHEQEHIQNGELYDQTYNEYGGEENEETDHNDPDPGAGPAGARPG